MPSRSTSPTRTLRRRTLAPAVALLTAALALTLSSTFTTITTSATAATTTAVPAARFGVLDTGSKAAVTAAWRAQWLPAARSRVLVSGGSTVTCTPYTTSATTLRTMGNAINFARTLSGVAPVTSLADPGQKAARSALIQAANTTLNHYPARSSRCYTVAGARAAARSDIGLWAATGAGWRPTVAAVVNGYLTDRGSSNIEAPHRTWLLRTAARHLATGFAIQRAGGFTWTGNDIVVFPDSTDVNSGPRFHAWPAQGYFPIQLEPHGRWSLSAKSSKVSFAHARVRVTKGSRTVASRSIRRTTGYGDNSIVWQLAKRPRVKSGKSATYCVKISRITHARTQSYCIRFFRP